MKKKALLTSLIFTLVLQIVGFLSTPVFAETTDEYGYTYSCGNQYEVDEIRDDGGFTSKGCYLTLDAAKNKMRENENYVVRYSKGRSPMKIVAMNSGLAYAYPQRSNKNTLYVYETSDEKGITSYTQPYREMVYRDTTIVVDNKAEQYLGWGIIKVNLNGFEGYTDLECVDLIPFKYIDNKIPCYTGLNSSTAQKFIVDQNYYVVRQNGNYKDLCLNYAISVKHPNADDSTQSGELHIGLAPSFMNVNQIYYSPDGVSFYSDSHMKNYVGTNYNYFQFLSIRSKANLTADQINGFLSSMGKTSSAFYGSNAQAFIDAQNTYGMNALLIFALACNESGYGTSLINTNNIFGLGAYDGAAAENAYGYESIAACINDLEGWHLAKYCDYYGTSHFYTAPYFGNKGIGISLKYASDPYECYKVSAIAYKVDKYINGNNGSLTNYNAYNLALVNKTNVPFKASANNSSATLYMSQAGDYTSYQKDNVVTVIGQEGNFAKVISGNPIDQNRNVVKTVSGYTTYNHDLSYAYVSIDNLTPLNKTDMFNTIGEYIGSINKIEWNNNLLHIEGNAKTENLTDSASASLMFVGGTNHSFDIKASQSNDSIIINKDIDIKDLPIGTYDINWTIKYPNYSSYNKNTKLSYATLPSLKIINNKVYSFRKNGDYLTLRVTNAPEETKELLALSDIKLQKNTTTNHIELYIKGIGVLEKYDSLILDDTTHKLVLVNLEDTTNTIEIPLNNTSAFYSINDGFMYKEGGFEGTIDIDSLTDYPIGSYGIAIETSNGGRSAKAFINTINSSYSNISINNQANSILYRITTDDFDLNRVQLSIENVYEDIDYSKINKPSTRTSLTNITDIKFEEISGKKSLRINAAVMMYYLNYNNEDNVKYNVYLIDDNSNKLIKMDTVNVQNKYDYQTNYGSSYNMDHISFEATCPLDSIPKGNYRMVVYIENKENSITYLDYVDLIQAFDIQRDSYEYNNLSYSFNVSNVRYRLMLKVVDK